MRTKLTVCHVPVLRHRRWTGNRCGKLGGARRLAMNQIINIDIENMQATAQCGFRWRCWKTHCAKKVTPRGIPAVKAAGADGRPGGDPQYRAFSTLYGAIEDMVVGLEAVLAMAPSHALKTCHVARLARTFAYHHRQRRCSVLYH